MKIAFLGLGSMGSGMAHNLLRAGYSVTVWNRSANKLAPFIAAGAAAAPTPEAAVTSAQIVFSSLMDDASIHAVFDGPEGAIAAMAPGAVHICTTTISPECADRLAEAHAAAGSRYISGPVLGRPDAAAAGTLMQLLAGDSATIEEVSPVCKAIANNLVPMPGPQRVANVQKLCLNFFIIGMVELMAECYAFAEKGGASAAFMAQFFDRALALPGLKGYAARMFERNTNGEGGFSLKGGLKDVRLMLDAAKAAECPIDIANIVESKMVDCFNQGMAEADWSVILEATRARAGLDSKLRAPR